MPRRPPTSPRKTPRQERSQATVDAILDATARVLLSTGYDRASTNRVAVAAGVSIGSLYQYFPNKEALVAALAERHIAQMTAVIRAKVVELSTGDPPLERAAREIVRASVLAHMVDPKLHKVLMEQVPRVGRLERVAGVEQEMKAIIQAGLEHRRGRLRPRDLAMAAFVLVHAVEGVTHAAVMEQWGDREVERLIEEVMQMVVRYLSR